MPGLLSKISSNLYTRAKTVLFADDTHIRIRAANEDILNHKINSYVMVTIWFRVNGLVINNLENYGNIISHLAEKQFFKMLNHI